MNIDHPEGATPLDEDYREHLIPDLRTQAELNEFEQSNITAARIWATVNPGFASRLLTPGGLCELHRRMYGTTWRWAGRYRDRETNIGVAWPLIGEHVARLCDDAGFWIGNGVYPWAEAAVRLHHGLTRIHPFHNGNGRHARLAADLLLLYHDRPGLSWGGTGPDRSGDRRREYILALQEADRHSFQRLLRFVGADAASP